MYKSFSVSNRNMYVANDTKQNKTYYVGLYLKEDRCEANPTSSNYQKWIKYMSLSTLICSTWAAGVSNLFYTSNLRLILSDLVGDWLFIALLAPIQNNLNKKNHFKQRILKVFAPFKFRKNYNKIYAVFFVVVRYSRTSARSKLNPQSH